MQESIKEKRKKTAEGKEILEHTGQVFSTYIHLQMAV